MRLSNKVLLQGHGSIKSPLGRQICEHITRAWCKNNNIYIF